MADVRFLKSEVVITQPWTELSYRNLGLRLDIVKRVLSLKSEAGVDFQLHMAAIFKMLEIDMTS